MDFVNKHLDMLEDPKLRQFVTDFDTVTSQWLARRNELELAKIRATARAADVLEPSDRTGRPTIAAIEQYVYKETSTQRDAYEEIFRQKKGMELIRFMYGQQEGSL